MIKRQYTLYLENKPGVLVRLAQTLAKVKVNIEGISIAESTHTALVQLVVDNALKAKAALDKAKIPYTSQKVCVLELDHKPGALALLASTLARARINVNYIYGTAADDQDKCCLVISADNLKKVEEVAG